MSGDGTPNLDLKYLDPSQSQPEVKINDAWDKIDAAVGTIAVSDLSSPPIVGHAIEIQFVGATVTHETGGRARVEIDSAGSGGGGSPLTVTDGTHTVTDVTEIDFSFGGIVTDLGGGVAQVYIDPVSGGGSGSANITPDTHPAPPNTLDDEMEGTSLDAKWTWRNQGSTTAVFANGSIILGGVTDGLIHGITQVAPGSTPYTIETKVAIAAASQGSGTGIGLYVRNSSGNLYAYLLDSASGPLVCYAFNSPTSFNGALFSSATIPFSTFNTTDWVYMQIVNDGTNLKFNASLTGVPGSYQQIGTVALATFIGAVSDVGLVVNINVAGAVGIADWFRRTA